MKYISLAFIVLNLIHSCKGSPRKNNNGTELKIDLNDLLKNVLSDFDSLHCEKGVTVCTLSSCTNNVIAEIWCLSGWTEFDDIKESIYYTENNNSIFLVVENESFLKSPNNTNDKISLIIGDYLKNNLSTPPDSGYPHRWIYKIGKDQNDIYSVVDSMFKYDRKGDEFIQNLRSYTNLACCFNFY